jgi:hypothetical protein
MDCFGTIDFDNNSRLITLSAIIISGLHCITDATKYRQSILCCCTITHDRTNVINDTTYILNTALLRSKCIQVGCTRNRLEISTQTRTPPHCQLAMGCSHISEQQLPSLLLYLSTWHIPSIPVTKAHAIPTPLCILPLE